MLNFVESVKSWFDGGSGGCDRDGELVHPTLPMSRTMQLAAAVGCAAAMTVSSLSVAGPCDTNCQPPDFGLMGTGSCYTDIYAGVDDFLQGCKSCRALNSLPPLESGDFMSDLVESLADSPCDCGTVISAANDALVANGFDTLSPNDAEYIQGELGCDPDVAGWFEDDQEPKLIGNMYPDGPPQCETEDSTYDSSQAPPSFSHPNASPPPAQGPPAPPVLIPPKGTGHPVDRSTGQKIESAVDLSLALTGDGFSLERMYRGANGDSGPGLVGVHWRMNWFSFVVEPSGSDPLKLYARNMFQEYTETSSGSTIWLADGPVTQKITEGTITYDPDDDGTTYSAATYAVWQLKEPGGWELDYLRADGAASGQEPPSSEFTGALARKRDVHGNTQTYYYTTQSKTGGGETIRLQKIVFERDTGSGMETIAEVWFYWDKYSANAGRLMGVEAHRPDKSTGTLTQRVDYMYKDDADSLHDATGSEGDLVQVDRTILLDGGAYRRLVTQYRYHGGLADETSTDTDGDGYIENGPVHALKMVIQPEQIEFFVQKRIGELSSPNYGESYESALTHLLGSADSVLLDDDLPAKMVNKHDTSGRVTEQHILAACGCSGSALGLKRTYAYYTHSSGDYARTTRMRDWRDVSGTWTFQSDAYFDLVEIDGGYRVANHAGLERPNESSSPTRTWVESRLYSSIGELELIVTPAANATRTYKTADDTGGPSFTSTTASSGLVLGYVYDSTTHRLTEARVNDGIDLAAFAAETVTVEDDFTLLSKTTYDSTRPYLVTKIERVRTTGTSLPGSSADIETTAFEYGFYSSGGEDLAWMKTKVEKEREAENGPVVGTGEEYFESYRLLDENGRLVWTRSADNVLSFRDYDDDTGQVTEVIQNSSTSQTPALSNWTSGLETNLTVTGWGRYGTNSVNDLKTTYTRDLLGRVIRVQAPGGVNTWIVREMAENSLRPGFDYYREVSVPTIITDGSSPVLAGPVGVSWMNAGGSVIRSSSYEMDDVDDADVAGTYVLGTELSRSAVVHYASGLVHQSKAWHDVAGNGAYTTTFAYDALGRMTKRTAANGTETEYVYDIMDRVVETKIGASGESALSVMAYYYDSGLTTPAQGVGNGNVTLVVQHVDSNSANDRTTKHSFDYRDRLVMTENPDEPHSAMAYDNLDRVTEQIVFQGSPPGTRTLANVTAGNRGRRVLTHYGQRGMVYKTQIATDPTATSGVEYLETHRWFDEVGRVVGQWGPNAPGSKTTYDALGRVVKSYVTDRGGDDEPGSSGNFADVYNAGSYSADLTGDKVLEQTEYAYVDVAAYKERGEGQASLITHRMRGHDDSGTGELGTGAVAMFRGFYYDTANRLIRSVDYGTNQSAFADQGGTSAPTITQTSPPDPNAAVATQLVSAVTYNTRGLTEIEEDPEEIETKTLYDDLGRVIAVIENYANAVIAWDGTGGRWQVTSGITDAEPDTDRVTSFVYNEVGEIVRRVAHVPSGTSETIQETKYTYAARTSAGDTVNSNDLLTMIQYPDESAGTAGTASTYKVLYTYNRLGELLTETDQNQTEKTYTRDDLGRVTQVEAVIGTGSDVDDAIDTIEYAYDAFSRLDMVTSRFKTGGAVANEIAYAYDELWQLEGIKQNPVGATTAFSYTSSVLDLDDGMVGYIYHIDDAANTAPSNQSRLSAIHYPRKPSTATIRTVLNFDYGASAGDLDDTISRVTGLTWNTGDTSGTHTDHTWAQEFVGVSMPVIGNADEALGGDGLKLDRFLDPADGDTASGTYGGFDRYGRLLSQHWADGSWQDFTSSTPTRPEIYNLQYAYSNHSDITKRLDNRGYASNADRDEEYSYDGLHRLVLAERGVSAITSAKALSQTWPTGSTTGLDMLGNWNSFGTDFNGDDDYTDTPPTPHDETLTRAHNKANEITSVSDGGGSWGTWEYDDNGNLTLEYLSSTSRRRFTYDPWDRLVHVGYEVYESSAWSALQDRAEFTYYGLHQRATTKLDTDQDMSYAPDQAIHYYYDASWRLLERRIDDGYTDDWGDSGAFTSSAGSIETHQYIWGTGYIDELVYYQRDLNLNHNFNDDTTGRHYVLRDRNYSVIGVTGGSGGAGSVERVRYTAYGESQVQIPADVTGEGTIGSDDLNVILGAWEAEYDGSPAGYKVEADLIRDGVIDVDDLNVHLGAPTSSVDANTVGYGTGNIVGYAGYIFEEEIGLYCVRHRWYDPGNGRWIARDPIGTRSEFVPNKTVFGMRARLDWIFFKRSRFDFAPVRRYSDGAVLYNYAHSAPLAKKDPFGTDVWIEGPTGDEPAFHRSICIGDPNGIHTCYSFGMCGMKWYGKPIGKVYIDWEGCGKIEEDYYIQADKDIDKMLKEIFDDYIKDAENGARDVYNVRSQCRTFSYSEFDMILESLEKYVDDDKWEKTKPPVRTQKPPKRNLLMTPVSSCSRTTCTSSTTTSLTTSSGGGNS